MSRPNEENWLQFYQNHQPPPSEIWSGDAARVVTTANSGVSNHLSRVTRPTTTTNNRRRSRVSKKTPTTLLNTDTTNFRAMVQQFTGGGSNGGGAPVPPHAAAATSVTATQPSLSSYGDISCNMNDGFVSNGSVAGGIFRQPDGRQGYFTADDGGSSGGYDGGDQNMVYGQRGSYNW